MATKDTSSNDGDGGQFDCPWDGCGYTSVSEAGVKIHHKRIHGESIAGVVKICEQCTSTYRRAPCFAENSRFCCRECRTEADKKENVVIVCENCGDEFKVNPARADEAKFCSQGCTRKRVELVCEWCGELFEATEGNADSRRFCSVECDREWRSEYLSGENSPAWEGGEIAVECEKCGGEVKRGRWKKEKRNFCGRNCYNQWRSETQRGKNAPNWRGGTSVYYTVRAHIGDSWHLSRRDVRERDDRKCQNCGHVPAAGDAENDVHHIIPILCGGVNSNELLMTLCGSCHRRAESFTQQFLSPVLTD